ncbi:hypothetical protein V7S43_009085 [Phytophthora oleae]|uniref:BZIP domain-containing protein n=1 Tax=Phytophthora oleae TaxID=2107226 RepID=A0ABD3FJA9_9STRA
MSSSDAAFLAEVEDFLVSCDLPTFPVPSLGASDGSDELLAANCTAIGPTPVDDATNSKGGRKNTTPLDAATKLERKRANDRKRRSTYRERRQIEKETLKRQIGELSAEVVKLQNAKRSVTSTAWELVAKRHAQARQNAEDEQQFLVKNIASRAKTIQDFSKYVDNYLTKSTFSPGAALNKRTRLQSAGGDIFEMYLGELDVLYAQTDRILTTHGLDDSGVGWSDPRREWVEDNAGYFIYTDKHLLPIEFERACDYVWHVAQLQHRQDDRQHYDGVKNLENTTAFKFRMTKVLNSGRTVSVLLHAVARRYLEADKMVVVWKTFIEGEGMFTGMHADECGWCVSTPSSTTSEPKTLMRTVMRHVPMQFNATSTKEPVAEQFTGLLLTAGSKDATEIGNKLSKLQLHDSH